MKKITDSSIFNQIIKNASVKNNLKNIVISRDTVDLKLLEEPLGVIKKRMIFPSKSLILNSLKNGDLILIYNPLVKLPKYFNTFGKIDQGKLKSIVDISQFAHNGRDTEALEIFPKTLFSLCQNGVVIDCLMKNWNKVTTNIGIVKNSSFIYSKLMSKIFDKLFAINIDPVKSDLIHFLLAKFFLVNMCERIDNDTTDNVAYYSCFHKTKLERIKQEEATLGDSIYENLFVFFDAVSSLNGMDDLNSRSFVENYARMYGESTILAIDNLSYFLSMIFSVVTSGNIAKDYIIESVVGKNVTEVYNEFFRIF